MRFNGKRDGLFLIIWAFLFIVFSCVSLFDILTTRSYWSCITFSIILLVFGLFFLLIYRTTYYIFEENSILCTTLFIKKRIPYRQLRKVEKSNGLYAGWKMNTSWNCLVIIYNQYDELLISPEKEEEFIIEFEKRIIS